MVPVTSRRWKRPASSPRPWSPRPGPARPRPASTEPGWHTRPMRFRATVELGGKTATGIEVPEDVVAGLGSGNRPPVTVTIGGHTNRTKGARMGGRFLIPLSAENRAGAGVVAGDPVAADTALGV